MVAKKNLIGATFGSLTVVASAGSNKDGRALWLCHCICGEKRIASGKDLGKKITRCRKKCVLTDDLRGLKVGYLLILNQEGSDRHGFRQFRCLCSTPLEAIANDRENNGPIPSEICGNKILVNAVALRQHLKNPQQNKIPKCCERCSRILGGKLRRLNNPMENLSGRTFGRLTAHRRIFRGNGTYKRPLYECTCSCGSGITTYVRQEALFGKSDSPIRSCGCLRIEASKNNKTNLVHGLSNHPLYNKWSNMIRRCYDEKCRAFPQYGGRGIEMCKEWLENFVIFYEWAMANGWTNGLEVDRINNDGPYSPKNCQLLTKIENVLKLHRDYGRAFILNGKQININKLSEGAAVSSTVCRKMLLNYYSEEDVLQYGKLPLHQKNALSRSIHQGSPISIEKASKLPRKAKIKPPQSSEMGSYRAMMARCYNPKDSSYRNYGAKNIRVCPQWKNNPAQFLLDMGQKPEPKDKHALDRIDSSKDYSLDNCRWLSAFENSSRASKKSKRTVANPSEKATAR